MGEVLAVVASYLMGSTPVAFLAGKALRGIDLREHGSGNLGATNVYRTLGAPAAVVVLLLDALKGYGAVYLGGAVSGAPESWWPLVCGVAAILGHVRPYAGMFRGGGKGVATTAGVFSALAPIPFAIALGTFVLVTAVTRIVSLGSISGALALAAASLVRLGVGSRIGMASLAIAAFVIWTHRTNIQRLRAGTESRLGRPGGTTR